jgi:hypothetical protein
LKHEHNICINNMFACVFATKYAWACNISKKTYTTMQITNLCHGSTDLATRRLQTTNPAHRAHRTILDVLAPIPVDLPLPKLCVPIISISKKRSSHGVVKPGLHDIWPRCCVVLIPNSEAQGETRGSVGMMGLETHLFLSRG